MITYEVFNRICKEQEGSIPKRYTITGVQYSDGTCDIHGSNSTGGSGRVAIKSLVTDVELLRCTVSNPSAIKEWVGFGSKAIMTYDNFVGIDRNSVKTCEKIYEIQKANMKTLECRVSFVNSKDTTRYSIEELVNLVINGKIHIANPGKLRTWHRFNFR